MHVWESTLSPHQLVKTGLSGGQGLGWGKNLNLERGSESLLSPCAQFRVGEMSLSSDKE